MTRKKITLGTVDKGSGTSPKPTSALRIASLVFEGNRGSEYLCNDARAVRLSYHVVRWPKKWK